ncbi:hypothetical protein HYU23_01360 [Candidatus Woesearchaeota archaeon]|nr:hypothetical protein [Candidatus Woesearchaeota archaeon]
MKIAVIEDRIADVRRNYSMLVRSRHDVSVFYLPPNTFVDVGSLLEEAFSLEIDNLVSYGFRRDKITFPILSRENPYYRFDREKLRSDRFNIFFIDGLDGECFNIIRDYGLPKDKICIASDYSAIVDHARELGYSTVEKQNADIHELVDRLKAA